jgi:isopentenyl diphosphate isomerase/L-lactate dehydrogenase-like FMN-dependent dehydrogenase
MPTTVMGWDDHGYEPTDRRPANLHTIYWPRESVTVSKSPRFDSLAEVQRLTKRKLPRAMYNRLNGGADDGVTFAANLAAFGAVSFRPRAASVPAIRTTTTNVLGETVSLPVLLAPVGALRLQHPDGVVAAINAASDFGTICVISPGCGHPISELAPPADGNLWYQVTTAIGGREAAERDIEQAKSLGYKALVVTVDSGLRPKVLPIKLNVRSAIEFAPDLIQHPRWTVGFIKDGMRISVANAALGASQGPPGGRPVAWSDLTWIGEAWPGPVVVKGVLTGDDARRSIDAGAAAIVVSNHGGLTLDGVPATLSALPEVLEANQGRVEVLMDGGVRSGADVVKAVALGARAVLIGRCYVMGLAVDGAAGVKRVLEILQDDIQRTLAFLGCDSVQQLGPDHVWSTTGPVR